MVRWWSEDGPMVVRRKADEGRCGGGCSLWVLFCTDAQ